MAKQTLEAWIREAMTDDDKDGTIHMMSLVHLVAQTEKEIHTVRFGGKAWNPKDLAGLFRRKAEGYAQDIPGVQTFNLLAFYGGRNEAEARHPFTVSGELDYGGLATEGPTPTGLVQQMMRHNEVLMQTALRSTASSTETQAALIQQLFGMLTATQHENAEVLALAKQLILERATNTHQFTMEEIKARREADERRKLLSYAPALLDMFFPGMVPRNTADTALIESIAESLDEKKIAKLSEIIPQNLWGPIAARLNDILKNKNEAEADARRALKDADPEDDIGGVPELHS